MTAPELPLCTIVDASCFVGEQTAHGRHDGCRTKGRTSAPPWARGPRLRGRGRRREAPLFITGLLFHAVKETSPNPESGKGRVAVATSALPNRPHVSFSFYAVPPGTDMKHKPNTRSIPHEAQTPTARQGVCVCPQRGPEVA